MKSEYENLIEKLTRKFEKTISNNESEKGELIEAFRKYLGLAIETIEGSNSKFVRKDVRSVSSVLTSIANELCNMDIISVKQNLLEDKSFEEIQAISGKAFGLARRKLDGEEFDETLESSAEIEKMNELLKTVRLQNTGRAKELISETILDLKFLDEENPNVLSLRLHHLTKNKLKKDIDEEER